MCGAGARNSLPLGRFLGKQVMGLEYGGRTANEWLISSMDEATGELATHCPGLRAGI